MRKTIFGIGAAFMACAMLFSCNKGEENANDSTKVDAKFAGHRPLDSIPPLAEGSKPSYRFINFDSIVSNYNLAIDFTEDMIRQQQDFQTQYQAYLNKQIDMNKKMEKMYTTTDADEAERLKTELQNFGNTASKTEENLQNQQMQLEIQQAQNLKVIMDSVQSYLRVFAPANGYTAIFLGSNEPEHTIMYYSAPYFHPDLDVTNEVIEGLNARYNKVGK